MVETCKFGSLAAQPKGMHDRLWIHPGVVGDLMSGIAFVSDLLAGMVPRSVRCLFAGCICSLVFCVALMYELLLF